jgi:AraC-like DNA-binding protein
MDPAIDAFVRAITKTNRENAEVSNQNHMSARDRRKHPRYDLNLEATVHEQNGGDEFTARFQNFSRGGAYFIGENRLSPGDHLEIRMGDGLMITGEVLRVERLFDSHYGFAVRFASADASSSLSNDDGAFQSAAPGVLSELYQLELRTLNERAFSYYPRLERVRNYVEDNLCEEITLEDAAKVAAMERTYFSYFFRQKLGVTFSAWLQYLRVSRALDLIRSRDHSITEVAFAVGFNELSTFQKAFKRWTSLTPRDFKKLARPA